MPDRIPTPDEIANLISEDVNDFPPMGDMGGPEGPEDLGAGDEEGIAAPYDPAGEDVEPISMDKSLLEKLLYHMMEIGEENMEATGEDVACAIADAAVQHSKEEPTEDPDSAGVMTGERDFYEIVDKAREILGMKGEEMPQEIGADEMGGEEEPIGEPGGEEAGSPFESKEKTKPINESREKFRKIS